MSAMLTGCRFSDNLRSFNSVELFHGNLLIYLTVDTCSGRAVSRVTVMGVDLEKFEFGHPDAKMDSSFRLLNFALNLLFLLTFHLTVESLEFVEQLCSASLSFLLSLFFSLNISQKF